MSRFLTVLLSALTLSSLIGLAWVMGRPTPLDPRIVKLETENDALKGELARLRDQLKKQETAKAGGKPKDAAAATPPTGGVTAPQPVASNNGKAPAPVFTGSSFLDNMATSQIDMGYGKLMTLLGLNDQEKAHFKKLLFERDKYKSDTMRQMLGKSPAERKKLTDEMEAQQMAYDKAIKAFLNDAGDYDAFQQWEDTRLERVQFERTGRALFDNSSEPLSEEQESQLMVLMAEARKAPTAPKYPIVSKVDAATATGRIDTFVQQTREAHQALHASAANILSPAQLQVLNGYLAQNREAMERTLRMMIRSGTP